VFDPLLKMPNGKRNAFRLTAAADLSPASCERLFMLLRLQLGKQESVAHAHLTFREGFGYGGHKLTAERARQ